MERQSRRSCQLWCGICAVSLCPARAAEEGQPCRGASTWGGLRLQGKEEEEEEEEEGEMRFGKRVARIKDSRLVGGGGR